MAMLVKNWLNVLSYNEFYELVLSDYAIQQRIVYVIDNQSRQVLVESQSDLLCETTPTIKVEQMERYNQSIFHFGQMLAKDVEHDGPVTCHAFRSYAGSPSFTEHTDPDDVYLYVLEGQKDIEMYGKVITITAGDKLFIPANTVHKAINTNECLMLSFAMENYIQMKVNNELDVLSKNY